MIDGIQLVILVRSKISSFVDRYNPVPFSMLVDISLSETKLTNVNAVANVTNMNVAQDTVASTSTWNVATRVVPTMNRKTRVVCACNVMTRGYSKGLALFPVPSQVNQFPRTTTPGRRYSLLLTSFSQVRRTKRSRRTTGHVDSAHGLIIN